MPHPPFDEFRREHAFWSKVKRVPDGCWEWLGYRREKGYGQVFAGWDNYYRTGNKYFRAHRVAYQYAIGPIPEGLRVCHSCDNPSCVRPSHLWVGTDKDNTQDMIRKGRSRLKQYL